MTQERLIVAIGRIERALTRLESAKIPSGDDSGLSARHDALKAETQIALRDLDALLNGGSN